MKGHFGISAINEGDRRPSLTKVNNNTIARHERMEFDEQSFLDKVRQENQPSPLGIWESSPYKVALLPIENGFAGVVVDAPGANWQKGQVKLKMFREGKGNRANIWMGDFSLNENRKIEFIGNNVIQIDSFAFFNRKSKIFEDTPAAKNYIRSIYASQPYYERLSDSIGYLRIPSFAMSQKHSIDSVIRSNEEELKNTSNLVINLRNNGGGSDASYQSLLPYLYTNPIRTTEQC